MRKYFCIFAAQIYRLGFKAFEILHPSSLGILTETSGILKHQHSFNTHTVISCLARRLWEWCMVLQWHYTIYHNQTSTTQQNVICNDCGSFIWASGCFIRTFEFQSLVLKGSTNHLEKCKLERKLLWSSHWMDTAPGRLPWLSRSGKHKQEHIIYYLFLFKELQKCSCETPRSMYVNEILWQLYISTIQSHYDYMF